jgi:hypothetical protein
VITSLILILTTVSLATVFFFWALGYMGQSQTAVATGINQNNGKVQEQFAVSQVRFWCSGTAGSPCTSVTPNSLVSTGDMVTIYVSNFGDIPVTIDHIYFDGTLFAGYSTTPPPSCPAQYCFSTPTWQSTPNCIPSVPYTPASTAPPITISARGVGCINVQLSAAGLNNWNVGETHTVEVASTRGNQYSQGFTVPTQNWG